MNLLGWIKCKASLHISSAGIAGRGRYNNDTRTHLDIGDPYLDASGILDFQHFSTGAKTLFPSKFAGRLLLSFCKFIALCFLGRYVFAHDKTSFFKSGHIVEFSKDMDSFGFM